MSCKEGGCSKTFCGALGDNYFYGAMAEWLRRQIRISNDLFPSGSAGSNPAGVVLLGWFRILSPESWARRFPVDVRKMKHIHFDRRI